MRFLGEAKIPLDTNGVESAQLAGLEPWPEVPILSMGGEKSDADVSLA